MTVERTLRLIAGSFILLSLALGHYVSPPGIDYGVLQRHSLGAAQFDEVDKNDGIANNDAGPSNEADHRRCGKESPHQRVCGQNANQRERDRRRDDQRRDERPEPAYDQDVNTPS